MPVWKMTLDEARRALWHEPGDPAILKSWDAVCGLSSIAPRVSRERGVRKFKTIEDLNADTDAFIVKRVKAAQARVVKKA